MTKPDPRVLALAAANRIMHNDYPQTWTLEKRQQAFIDDAQYVAGAYAEASVVWGSKPTAVARRGYMKLRARITGGKK